MCVLCVCACVCMGEEVKVSQVQKLGACVLSMGGRGEGERELGIAGVQLYYFIHADKGLNHASIAKPG